MITSKESQKIKAASGVLIESEIRIAASSQRVWEVLSDFEKYPEWNPFIKSISGKVQKGNKLKVLIHPPKGSQMKFNPKVTECNKNKELSWLGHLLFPGLFDGAHSFIISDNLDGSVTFVQKENFKGVLAPLFKKMLLNNTLKGFQLMNQKLKERVEAS